MPGYGQASSSYGADGAGGSAGAFQDGGLGVVSGATWDGTKGHFDSNGNLEGYSQGTPESGINVGYGQADSSFGSKGKSGSNSVDYKGNQKAGNNSPSQSTERTGLNKNGNVRTQPKKFNFKPKPTAAKPAVAKPKAPYVDPYLPAYMAWKNPTSFPVGAPSWKTKDWSPANPATYTPNPNPNFLEGAGLNSGFIGGSSIKDQSRVPGGLYRRGGEVRRHYAPGGQVDPMQQTSMAPTPRPMGAPAGQGTGMRPPPRPMGPPPRPMGTPATQMQAPRPNNVGASPQMQANYGMQQPQQTAAPAAPAAPAQQQQAPMAAGAGSVTNFYGDPLPGGAPTWAEYSAKFGSAPHTKVKYMQTYLAPKPTTIGTANPDGSISKSVKPSSHGSFDNWEAYNANLMAGMGDISGGGTTGGGSAAPFTGDRNDAAAVAAYNAASTSGSWKPTPQAKPSQQEMAAAMGGWKPGSGQQPPLSYGDLQEKMSGWDSSPAEYAAYKQMMNYYQNPMAALQGNRPGGGQNRPGPNATPQQRDAWQAQQRAAQDAWRGKMDIARQYQAGAGMGRKAMLEAGDAWKANYADEFAADPAFIPEQGRGNFMPEWYNDEFKAANKASQQGYLDDLWGGESAIDTAAPAAEDPETTGAFAHGGEVKKPKKFNFKGKKPLPKKVKGKSTPKAEALKNKSKSKGKKYSFSKGGAVEEFMKRYPDFKAGE